MSGQQRLAVFNLCVVTAVLVLWAATLPMLGPMRATGMFGLLFLLGLGGWRTLWFGRGKGVGFDERDRAIQQRALITAYTVFWVVLIIGGTSVCLAYESAGAVPVPIMGAMIYLSLIVVTATHSLATLILYGRSA